MNNVNYKAINIFSCSSASPPNSGRKNRIKRRMTRTVGRHFLRKNAMHDTHMSTRALGAATFWSGRERFNEFADLVSLSLFKERNYRGSKRNKRYVLLLFSLFFSFCASPFLSSSFLGRIAILVNLPPHSPPSDNLTIVGVFHSFILFTMIVFLFELFLFGYFVRAAAPKKRMRKYWEQAMRRQANKNLAIEEWNWDGKENDSRNTV